MEIDESCTDESSLTPAQWKRETIPERASWPLLIDNPKALGESLDSGDLSKKVSAVIELPAKTANADDKEHAGQSGGGGW